MTKSSKHKKIMSTAEKKQTNAGKRIKNKSFPIVAIGASAGGLEALESFFTPIEDKTGMAYVVISHIDPDYNSRLTDLLKKYTSMSVFTIVDGVKIIPDTIYVIPPGKNIVTKDGLLYLIEVQEPHYRNLPFNFFLNSLAIDRHENAIAIILSGSGADGTLGIRDIKLNGGLVIAQEPASATFDSMPNNAIHSGLVDLTLLPEQMCQQIIKWREGGDAREIKLTLEFQQIFSIIRSKTGYDFSSYKLNTISRRIEKQMQKNHINTVADYISFLKDEDSEVDNLFKGFLIGVTRFFRDPEAFEIFADEVIPEMLKKKPQDYTLRVWVPGCSSGEEVYSIAMAITEYFEKSKKNFCVQIFGTDIDRDALSVARLGVYPEEISNDVNPERLKRFFIKDKKNNYKIKKEIRSMIVFGEQNLVKDPPFTKVDFISCRNLLIYLNVKLQKKILPIFHYSLKPKGALFLGMSESIAGYTDLFESINRKAKFFQRKDSTGPHRQLLSFSRDMEYNGIEFNSYQESMFIDEDSEISLAIKKYLLEQFISPCILINKKGNILYTHGKLDKYVNTSSFLQNLNISEVIHSKIKSILKSAITTASLKRNDVIYHNLSIKHLKDTIKINLRVIHIDNIEFLDNVLLVLFEEGSSPDLIDDSAVSNKTTEKKKNKIINDLENELHYTKENLQATIEELESSNEELQSMNEELQSSNEELETSKEELHALNEELVVMNTELQTRIDQLACVNDDITNLFNSTEIATLFLDNNLCVKRYTPQAQEFIPLIPADIGRSISHFATIIKYEKLIDDIEEVLRTLNQKTLEVQSKSDRWFSIRILPYRTISNMIDGVIVTLTDVTQHKIAEMKQNQLNAALQNALLCSKNIIDTVMTPLILLKLDMKIISANRAFYKRFNLLPEEVIGQFIFTLTEFNIPELKFMLDQYFPEDNLLGGYEIHPSTLKNEVSKLHFNARKIFNYELDADVILLAMESK